MNLILPVCLVWTMLLSSICLAGDPRTSKQPNIFVQLGHSNDVKSLSFSPDGKYLVSSGADKAVKLWDVATGREMMTFVHDNVLVGAFFAPDGVNVFSADEQGILRLWDIATGESTARFGRETAMSSTAYSRDGKFALSFAGSLDYYDLTARNKIFSLEMNESVVQDAAFSNDGKFVVMVAESFHPPNEKTINILDVKKKKIIRSIPVGPLKILAVALSPDGKYIISGNGTNDKDSEMHVWDVLRGERIKTFSLRWPVFKVAFSPDGNYAATGSYGDVSLFDAASWEKRGTFKGTLPVAFSNDNRFLAYAKDLSETNELAPSVRGIEMIDLTTGESVQRFARNAEYVKSATFNSTGREIVAEGSRCSRWDLMLGKRTRAVLLRDASTNAAILDAVTPDAVYGMESKDRMMRLWDIAAGKILQVIPVAGTTTASRLCFSRTGKYLVAGMYDGNVAVWDMSNRTKLRAFPAKHTESVDAVAFSPDERFSFSGSYFNDGTIKMWDVATGALLRTYEDASRVASLDISSDGKYILSGGSEQQNYVVLWNVATGMKVKVFKGHTASVNSVAFSADGQHALSGGFDHTIILWDVKSGKEVKTFKGHSGIVTSVAFSPDGMRLVSTSRDGTTRMWDAGTGKEIIQFISFRDGEWVAITPEGYFDASSNGAQYLNVSIGSSVYSIDNFHEQFFNPSYVASILQGNRNAIAADLRKGFTLPPEVKIVSPSSNTLAATEEISLTVIATDMGGGIDEIRLFQNGKLVSEDQRGMKRADAVGQKITKSYQLTLLSGINTFRAVALNRERTESNPDEINIELNGAQAASDLYLFAIGINQYQNTTYNLNYGRSDASAFLKAFVEKSRTIFKQVIQYQLYDGEATRPAIEGMFRTVAATAKPQDTFVFFYAGHGVMSEGSAAASSDFYLIPPDVTKLYGDDPMLAAKAISAAQLRTFCTSIKAQKQLVVLDACQSGGAVASFATRGASEERAIMQLARSAGTVLLASTGTEQFATEFSTLSHGVFTYALLQGLNGEADGGNPKDGKITVKELEAYLNDQVPELTKKYRGTAQYPNSYARGQDFPLGVK